MVGDIVVIVLFFFGSLLLIFLWEVTLPVPVRDVYSFVERFHATILPFPHILPPRPRTDACMHM